MPSEQSATAGPAGADLGADDSTDRTPGTVGAPGAAGAAGAPGAAGGEGHGLSVAVDATPLLGRPTGVGVFCLGALQGLAGRDDVAVDAYAVSWRRRDLLAGRLPEGVGWHQRAMPARPLLHAWSWGLGTVPPIEWFIGDHDVVHGTNFVVPPARRSARVVTVHDLTIIRYPELCDAATLRFPAYVRRALADGAWVHTHSEFVATEVVDVLGADLHRVRVVPPGVPTVLAPAGATTGTDGLHDDGAPSPSLPLPPGTDRYILAIGTVEPRKDYPSLLAAFTELARHDESVALVIAGADGWGADAFGSALAALPAELAVRVVRTGYLDDDALDRVLRSAAVLAYPSVYEGFGLPPLQAMAAGVPVVTTRAGSVPEVVGDAAAVVAPGDVDALGAALAKVLAGGPGVDAMIRRGIERAGGYTWERCAAGLAALYRAAASG